jgi:hypothetical protein
MAIEAINFGYKFWAASVTENLPSDASDGTTLF